MENSNATTTATTETEIAKKNRLAKEDANWKTIGDVNWGDLEHFIGAARRLKDKNSFDTCERILAALRRQLGVK